MNRQEYIDLMIRNSGMERHHWLETFRVYPCWCGHADCPGWRHYTDREIQVILAGQEHWIGIFGKADV